MPAAITDKLTKVGQSGTFTGLTAPKEIGDPSIALDAVTNWPTDTAVYFAMRRVDTTGKLVPNTYTEWKGVVSGSSVTQLQLVAGNDQEYPADETTQVYISLVPEQMNQIIAVLLGIFDQNGSLKDGIILDNNFGKLTGWFASSSWSFDSWDNTTKVGVINVANAATFLSPGFRVRLTQSTGGTKYGIIMKVDTSKIHVFFGTDYTLNNEDVNSPVYAQAKAPFGFPLDPDKWTLRAVNTQNQVQLFPSASTWYNIGGFLLAVGVGAWDLGYETDFYSDKTSGTNDTIVTLSSTNNGSTDNDFTARAFLLTGQIALGHASKRKSVKLTSPTTFYVNHLTRQSGANQLGADGSTATGSSRVIYARCGYL